MSSPNTDIKTMIDQNEAAKPHGGSFTPYILAMISIILILLFACAILIYFVAFNNVPTHAITLKNKTGVKINTSFGGYLNNGQLSSIIQSLSPGQEVIYNVTPGVNLIIQGYIGDPIVVNGENPFTTVILNLAANNYTGVGQLTNGETLLSDLQINDLSVDEYGVSVQLGYNIPITIESTAFNDKDLANTFSCGGPVWNHPITATGPNRCPKQLQYPGTTGYVACVSACLAGQEPNEEYCCVNTCTQSGGCEASWPDQNYYHAFANACPTCLITNCDQVNYSCRSSGGLTSYTITFLS